MRLFETNEIEAMDSTKPRSNEAKMPHCKIYNRVILGKIPEVIFPCCTSVPVLGGIPSYLGKPCTAEGSTVKNRKTVNR